MTTEIDRGRLRRGAVPAAFSWIPLDRAVSLDHEPNPSRNIDNIDLKAGWPPRVLEATSITPVETFSSPHYCSLQTRRRNIDAALSHPEVSKLLTGRWEVLGCNVVSERSQVAIRRVRAHFFSSSANRIIEVCLDDMEVTAVAVKAPHEYPESPIEMAQAISVARNSPQLSGKVDGMDAHAILQVRADAFATGTSTRCMLVIFTEKNDPTRELPVRYSAMVDLRAQSLMYVAFPCDESGSPCGKRQAQ